ncbi:hypothetical protein GCM10009616_39140 [Microlunatus lacustris]
MSTDTRPPQNPTPREAGYEEPARPKIELSWTQVLAGALAAMTAAFLGSRLSVAGTVVGAALASVVAAVAGSVYTASLRSTQHRVRTVLQARVAGSPVPATVETVEDRDGLASGDAPAQPSAPPGGVETARSRGPRLSWKNVVVASLAAFALAGLVLTGLELATGSALSGGDGTTVGRVAEPGRAAPQPVDSPTPAPSASTSPSGAPSATAEPSESGSPAPEETPEAPPEPEPEPSAEDPAPGAPAPSASSGPTAAPGPSTSSPVSSPGTDEG